MVVSMFALVLTSGATACITTTLCLNNCSCAGCWNSKNQLLLVVINYRSNALTHAPLLGCGGAPFSLLERVDPFFYASFLGVSLVLDGG